MSTSSASTPSDTTSNKKHIQAGQAVKDTKKRGNKGNFHGQHLQCLQEEVKGWLRASKSGKTVWLTAFWDRWFKKYRWHLGECPEEFSKVEPIVVQTPEGAYATNHATPASAGLSREDFDALSKKRDEARDEVVALGKKVCKYCLRECLQRLRNIAQQLQSWFHRQTGKAKAVAGAGVFSDLIQNLCQVSHPPRRPVDYKFYMNHPDHMEKCRTAFKTEWDTAGLPNSQRLHFQCKVAECLYNEEDEEVKEELKAQALNEYNDNLAAYEELTNGDLTLEGLATFGDLSKEVCRQNLTRFMAPLLELLRQVTDMPMCFIAGKPPAPGAGVDDFELVTVTSGRTVGPDPKEFEEFDREAFTKHVIGQFMLFLLKTVEDINMNDDMVARTAAKANQVSMEILDDPSLLMMPDGKQDVARKGKTTAMKTDKKKARKGKKAEVVMEDDESDSGEFLPDGGQDDDKVPNTAAEKPEKRPQPRPQMKTPTLPETYVLHKETKAYLAELPEEERNKMLREIRGHSQADFDRNNNIYKNRWLLKELDRRMVEREKSGGTNDILAAMGVRDKHTGVNESIVPATSTALATSTVPITTAAPNMSPNTVSSTMDAPSTPATVHVLPTTAFSAAAINDTTATSMEVDPIPATNQNAIPNPSTTPATVHVPHTPAIPAAAINDTAATCTEVDPIPATNQSAVPTTAIDASKVQCADDGRNEEAVVFLDNGTCLETEPDTNYPVDRTGWPTWLSSAYDVLANTDNLRGMDPWRALLIEWVTLERKYSFENPSGPTAFYTKTGRPPLVDWWSRSSRKRVRPEIPNVMPTAEEFANLFRCWWAAINPEWRERNIADGSLSLSARIEPKEKDRWDCMRKPGQCGILTLLVCLFHWFQVAGDTRQKEQWKEVLDDVQWVVGCINNATRFV
ncbi:hypothetical protein VKT23_019738 [Stygiomarasmius scandens]|uniref:Uncharacterized protein n=1 Tax=Marasmiellus scandens TaxID=2682957 RepID=A0ABR1INW7_9AGAR